jgi:hypothetical protein
VKVAIATKCRPMRLASTLSFLFSMAATASAFAVDGCKVLLCLASPGGPREFAACVPPINDLFRSLAMGNPFPTCAMVGNSLTRTGSFAAPMQSNYYNECPAGTTALPSGMYAIMAPNWVPADNNPAWTQNQTLFTGIGEGSGMAPAGGATANTLPPKVCVSGPPIARVRLGAGGGRFGNDYSFAAVYSSVTILQPSNSPNVIGVWIDGALYNQVHW